MRNHFDEQLDYLKQSMELMGTQCENAIQYSIQSLTEGSRKKAAEVMTLNEEIRREEREIENICLRLLMRQQPVARDLRDISASLKAVYDLERIGIISADIADIVLNENVTNASELIDIHTLSDTTSAMVRNAVAALNEKNKELAEKTIRMDDIVDQAFIRAKKTLADHFTPETNVEYILNLLMIAKYFEKIGDHAVNIAKWAVFEITGFHQ